jgi:Potential Queuosine, Q, salvage protein family
MEYHFFWMEETMMKDLLLPENLCASVRATCEQEYVRGGGGGNDEEAAAADDNRLVTIRADGIAALAKHMIQQEQKSVVAPVVWDEEGWHYRNDASPERVALYILSLDAINFCFWPSGEDQPYEYVDLATTLTSIATSDEQEEDEASSSSSSFALSPQALQTMTPTAMQELFAQHHVKHLYPPDMEERCRLWNEVGNVLLEHFDGNCLKLIQRANHSAVALVRLLVQYFSGFRDIYHNNNDKEDHDDDTTTTARTIYFLKRAQICVGDWNAALHLQLPDMVQLTTFADYRVPQLLRHLNVLVYDAPLATLVDAQTELPVHSAHEHAIRAATVVAVERLVVALRQQQQNQQQQDIPVPVSSSLTTTTWNATTTDWYLWQVGEKLHQQGTLPPHHRVRTIFY